jgi:hypothetical protein
MKTDARPPPKDPFVTSVNRSLLICTFAAVAALLGAGFVLEGSLSKTLADRDSNSLVNRFGSDQQTNQQDVTLTEGSVRSIARDELKSVEKKQDDLMRAIDQLKQRQVPAPGK